MTVQEVCANLVGDPWHLSLDQIKKLTPYQVRHVYFAKRDKDGNVEHQPGPGESPLIQSHREIFYAIWRGRNLADHRIEEKYKDHLTRLAKGK